MLARQYVPLFFFIFFLDDISEYCVYDYSLWMKIVLLLLKKKSP